MKIENRAAFPKVIAMGCAAGLAAMTMVSCVSKPGVETRPEERAEAVLPPAPSLTMKPHHFVMKEEMQRSFEMADEIIIGIYTDNFVEKHNNPIFYFDKFIRFNKETLAWGPVENLLLPVQSHKIKPEIITRKEFKSLTHWDRVGICWDSYEQKRYVYLVEGQPSIVFIEQIIDEVHTTSYRSLIDTYPVTEDCNARAIFTLMIRDFVKKNIPPD